MAIVRDSGLDWTVLAPSLLFGPRDGFFNLIAGLVRISPGVVPITGTGKARFQPLAIDDLARVVVAVLADDATIGREYPLGGPRYWTYREIVEEVLRAMGKRRVLVPMPVPLIRLVAGSAEFVRLPFPVATDQLRQLKFDNIGPLDSVESAFGFEPRPMEGGLAHVAKPLAGQEPASPSRRRSGDLTRGVRGRRPATLRAVQLIRTLVLAIAWLAAALLIALGGAGIIAARNHLPGTSARPELTWTGDQAAVPAMDAATDQLLVAVQRGRRPRDDRPPGADPGGRRRPERAVDDDRHRHDPGRDGDRARRPSSTGRWPTSRASHRNRSSRCPTR